MAAIFCSNCGAGNTSSGKFCFACGQALQQGALPAASAATGLLPAHTLLKQRYRILQSVGQGGMGAVYMAQDTNLGDRLVAVKEMSQQRLTPQEARDASENFKREAYLLAGLHHPNLPSIHDHFEEQGRWYLVMNFIEGQTLKDYINSLPGGKVSLQEGLQIGLTLCDVLEYLHMHKPPIIFRDLKPSNIMRSPQGRIYLIDFGIARHFKPGQAKDTANYGSMGYSPPEQYGRAQTTPRSDIYSLGATLYHLLSGYAPSLSPFRLPPFQSKAPDAPAQLVELITQMTALDEGMRPESIQEVRQELEQIVAAQAAPLRAMPPARPPIAAAKPTQLPPPAVARPAAPRKIQAPAIQQQMQLAPPQNLPGQNRQKASAGRITLAIIGFVAAACLILLGASMIIADYIAPGILALMYGLLLSFLAIIKDNTLPVSQGRRYLARLGISLGIFFIALPVVALFIFHLTPIYMALGLICGVLMIIVTRIPRRARP